MDAAPSAATLLQAVRAHGGEVTCLDTAGARLATGGGDRTLRLWRWQAGSGWQAAGEARAAHRYGVVVLRWSRAGAALASGGVDGAVRLWSGSLAARASLAAPAATAVRALCWAGGRVLAGHDDGALCVWAPWPARLLARLRPHEGALHALAAPAHNVLLLTACTDGVLKVFDLAEVCASGAEGEGSSPAPLQWVDGAHDLGALCADAAESGAAATGGHDARIRVWQPAAGPRLVEGAALEGHSAAVTALRWAGALLASAALDRTARLWAPAQAACLLAVAAHPRYLTCVALAPDLRYLITGSNDKSFRTWSLGEFSLADEIELPCTPLEHFALGDLEGIGPVDDAEDSEVEDAAEEDVAGGEESADDASEAGGVTRAWSDQVHAGAINCVAACGDLLATASSDGAVKLWRWLDEVSRLELLHELRGEGGYPALAVDFGAAGTVLLAAGLDGCAQLYDVQSGVSVRSLSAGSARGGEAGGGGIRGARLSPHRAPLALLATDDGVAPLWRLADPDPQPMLVYTGHVEAVTCCAWSADGVLAATGAASGELRLLAPPLEACLHHDSHAHDLGVLSCDFAPACSELSLPARSYVLATAGCDALVKLWLVQLAATGDAADTDLLRALPAHGGATAAVRWGAGGALASAGADRWARVWRVRVSAGVARVRAVAAAPVRGAGGAPAVALAGAGSLLAVGALAGELAVWRLRPAAPREDPAAPAPHLWGEPGVLRWLRDYIVDAPGSPLATRGAELAACVRGAGLTGTRLLRDPETDLLRLLGLLHADEEDSSEAVEEAGETEEEGSEETEEDAARAWLRAELRYLRRAGAMPPPPHVEAAAPHALLCPLSHRLLAWPARAADGFTYERATIAEWLAAAGPVPASPVTGRALPTTTLAPNYGVLRLLRAFRAEHDC